MRLNDGERFVLKDERNNYVGSNSISYDKETKQFFYSYSEWLTNGFYTYPTESSAKEVLKKLQEIATKNKISIYFHVEKINKLKISTEENKSPVPRDPFTTVQINEMGMLHIA